MSRRVIISLNEDGYSVCVTYPAEKTVDELIADYPNGRIVFENTLPTLYFNAWRIVGENVVIDLTAAKDLVHENLNYNAIQKAKERSDLAAIGLPVTLSNEDFIALVDTIRAQIDNASSVTDLSQINLTV